MGENQTDKYADALRQLLAMRTAPEWDMRVQDADRALVEGRAPALTPAEYESLLAPIVRLRLRRALMHALQDGLMSGPATAQVTGYISHARGDARLEELLDPARFPNLASPDFGFLREIKGRLGDDVKALKAAVSEE